MTDEQAKQEATKRWGPDAFATRNFQITDNCTVMDHPLHPKFWGYGSTWEQAFKDADERAARMGHVDYY